MGFIGFDARSLKTLSEVVKNLRGRAVEKLSELTECTHIVVHKPSPKTLKRTDKLCLVISLQTSGVPVVTESWIHAVETANAFVSTASHLLEGPYASASSETVQGCPPWSFDATESRARALQIARTQMLSPSVRKNGGGEADGGVGCLSGHQFFVTKSVKPDTVRKIISAAGGIVLNEPPSKRTRGEVLVVSNEEDKLQWAPLIAKQPNVTVVKSEHLLTCILRQQLDLHDPRGILS